MGIFHQRKELVGKQDFKKKISPKEVVNLIGTQLASLD